MDYRTLISRLSMDTGQSPAEVTAKTDAVCEALKAMCRELDSVAIPGFGTFSPVKEEERIVSSPDGGRTLLPPRVYVEFKSSVVLRKALGK